MGLTGIPELPGQPGVTHVLRKMLQGMDKAPASGHRATPQLALSCDFFIGQPDEERCCLDIRGLDEGDQRSAVQPPRPELGIAVSMDVGTAYGLGYEEPLRANSVRHQNR